MNYTILNNEGLNFELKEKQLKQLFELQEEKLTKIGELFELGNVKPTHMNYRYEYNVKDTMTNGGVYSYITPQFKDVDKANELCSTISKGVLLNPFIELTYDGSLYIDGALDEDFLTIKQWEILNNHMKAQKDRAKQLCITLFRESDISWEDNGTKYCVEWFRPSDKITIGEFKGVRCFTPIFSKEKAKEIIEEYSEELNWYFTEYDPTIVLRVKIQKEEK